MSRRRRKYRLRRRWPMIMFFVLALCMLGSGYLYAMYWLYPPDSVPENPGNNNEVISGEKDPAMPEGRINFLLLGMDARKGDKKARTDTIILASIDAKSKQAAMLSIPRDTRVKIPGHGLDRINAANVYGGPELATRTVENLLGIPIDYYVLTNFNGFKDIVDVLGGVTIDVEKNMYYYDPTDNFLINLKKGTQRMDGDKAIQYVRFRNDALGDISRTERQQKFLKALAKEMLQPSTIGKLPQLVKEINKSVQTNLGLIDMLSLARVGKNLDDIGIISETLPGQFLDIDGLSYWGVDPDEAKRVVAKLFDGEKVSTVVHYSPTDKSEQEESTSTKPEQEVKTVTEKKNEQELTATEGVPKKISSIDVNISTVPAAEQEKADQGTGADDEEQVVPGVGSQDDTGAGAIVPLPKKQSSAGATYSSEKAPDVEVSNTGEAKDLSDSVSRQQPIDSGESTSPSKNSLVESDGNAV